MTDEIWHQMVRRALDIWDAMLLGLGITGAEILHAITLGALAAAILLVAVVVFSLLNGAAIRLATRRVAALAASADLPPRDRLARPFLYAFRHSSGLARWAALELSSSNREQPKPNGRASDGLNGAAAATSEGGTSMAAMPEFVVRAPGHFFTATIIVGGVGLVIAAAIIAFGPGLATAVADESPALPTVLNFALVAAMSAGGIGLTGLVSPLLLWPISVLARRGQEGLRLAVRDCISASANAPAPLVRPRDLRTIREIAQLRRLIDEERRARVEDSERLAQAISQMQEIGRLWQESNDVDGRGIIQAVRQLALGVANLHERIEADQSHHGALQISERDRNFISALGENIGRLAPLLDTVRDGEARITRMTERLTEAAEAAERSLRCCANALAAGDTSSVQPAIDELNQLLQDLAPGESFTPSATFDDEDGPENRPG